MLPGLSALQNHMAEHQLPPALAEPPLVGRGNPEQRLRLAARKAQSEVRTKPLEAEKIQGMGATRGSGVRASPGQVSGPRPLSPTPGPSHCCIYTAGLWDNGPPG